MVLVPWESIVWITRGVPKGRLHRNTFRYVDVILSFLDRHLKDHILSFRDKNPALSSRSGLHELSVNSLSPSFTGRVLRPNSSVTPNVQEITRW